MNKLDTSVLLSRARGCLRGLGVLLLLAGLGRAASAQGTVSVAEPFTVDQTTTICQGLRVAATSPWNVVVGWATADTRGICFRQRLSGYQWGQVQQVVGSVGVQPRDLDMTFDHRERLNMVWTALDGKTRRIFYARQDNAAAPPQAGPLLQVGADLAEGGSADFPAVSADASGGVVIVWQQSRNIRYSIRAVHILPGGAVEDLGTVSGVAFSGITPQVLATDPAVQVAWYEISETGNELLRVDEWYPREQYWRPAQAERDLQAFPKNAQFLVGKTGGGMLACGPEVLANGRSAIRLDLSDHTVLSTKVLAEPPGEHTRPNFSGTLPGRLTLAWQVFAQGHQWIQIAALARADQAPLIERISRPEHRFAAMPAHITIDNWSALVWTDDIREGGKGGIYFTQLTWPAHS